MTKSNDRGPRCPDCGAMVELDRDSRFIEVMTSGIHVCPASKPAPPSLHERIRESLARCSRCNDHVLPMVFRAETMMFDVTRHDCRKPMAKRQRRDKAPTEPAGTLKTL